MSGSIDDVAEELARVTQERDDALLEVEVMGRQRDMYAGWFYSLDIDFDEYDENEWRA